MRIQHPGDLGNLTREQLDQWHASIRQAAAELSEKTEFTDADREYSQQLIDWASEVTAAYEQAAEAAQPADADARAALAALGTAASTDTTTTGNNNDDGDGGETEGSSPQQSVMTAVEELINEVRDRIRTETPAASGDSGAPSVSDLAGNGVDGELPQAQATGPVMVAAADYGSYSNGQNLATRSDLAGALQARIGQYVSGGGATGPVLASPRGLGAARVMSEQPGHGFAPTSRSVPISGGHQRHNVARIARDDRGQFGTDPEQNREIALAASGDWVRQLRAGRMAATGGTARDTLIASWCGAAEAWDDLCEQFSLDGRVPLPTRTVPRGRVQFAEGYDFATVYDAVGDNTATPDELDEGVTKTCVEVPCLETPITGLNADWLCVTASLLQRRSWPESIESFLSAALAVKAHKTNSRIIAAMVDGSDDGGVITGSGDDDAFASFLSAVQVAITDMGYRAYMSMSGEWEVVAPAWVLPQLRHAVMRRRAIEDPVKADSWMQAQLAKINVTVHFVYGYQDAHVTTPSTGLPGGDEPITALPTEAEFIVYPAGTWVLGVNPVIELDTIYDSAGLETNSYTAIFVEDGWAALKVCPYSRVYTASVDPYGCGCATGAASS